MTKKQHKIASLAQYFDSLLNTNVIRSAFGFRGQTNSAWKILPSLFRGLTRKEVLRTQGILFRKLLTNAEEMPFLTSRDPVEYLIMLQHYGVPTKLLDITLDPLVGLFFACYDKCGMHNDVDGKVFLIPLDRYKRVDIDTDDLKFYREKHSIEEEEFKTRFTERIHNDQHMVLEPLFKNPRMRAQDGAFIMFSTNTEDQNGDRCLSLEEFNGAVNRWRKKNNINNPFWFGTLIIDNKHKKKILKELDEDYLINSNTLLLEDLKMNAIEAHVTEMKEQMIKYYKDNLIGRFSEVEKTRPSTDGLDT